MKIKILVYNEKIKIFNDNLSFTLLLCRADSWKHLSTPPF